MITGEISMQSILGILTLFLGVLQPGHGNKCVCPEATSASPPTVSDRFQSSASVFRGTLLSHHNEDESGDLYLPFAVFYVSQTFKDGSKKSSVGPVLDKTVYTKRSACGLLEWLDDAVIGQEYLVYTQYMHEDEEDYLEWALVCDGTKKVEIVQSDESDEDEKEEAFEEDTDSNEEDNTESDEDAPTTNVEEEEQELTFVALDYEFPDCVRPERLTGADCRDLILQKRPDLIVELVPSMGGDLLEWNLNLSRVRVFVHTPHNQAPISTNTTNTIPTTSLSPSEPPPLLASITNSTIVGNNTNITAIEEFNEQQQEEVPLATSDADQNKHLEGSLVIHVPFVG